MDNEKNAIYNDLIESAQKYYDSITDAADVEPAILMAGFVQSLLGKRKFIDLQSVFAYAAGQRAERSRIADKLDAMAMQNFNGSWAHVLLNFVDELRADPAESVERGKDELQMVFTAKRSNGNCFCNRWLST